MVVSRRRGHAAYTKSIAAVLAALLASTPAAPLVAGGQAQVAAATATTAAGAGAPTAGVVTVSARPPSARATDASLAAVTTRREGPSAAAPTVLAGPALLSARTPVAAAAGPVVPRRVWPVRVEWLNAPAAAARPDPWALFDGREAPAFGGLVGTVLLRLHFAGEVELGGLGVWGEADGSLSASVGAGQAGGAEQPLEGLTALSLSSVGAGGDAPATPASASAQRRHGQRPASRVPPDRGWRLFPAGRPAHSASLTLSWTTRGAALRELAVWALDAPAAGDPGRAVEQLHLDGLPGAHVVAAAPGELEVPSTSLEPIAPRVAVLDLDRDPRGFRRAFLVYELEGLPHWRYVPREINGNAAAPAGEPGLAPGSRTGGLQVEEIGITALRQGRNRITFSPARVATTAPGYRVRRLRLVGVPPADPVAALGPGAGPLGDGDLGTGFGTREAGPGRPGLELSFGEPVHPQLLTLALTAPLDATLILAPAEATGGKRRRLELSLRGLAAGRHHLAVGGALPPHQRYRFWLAGAPGERAGSGRLAELTLAGALAPRAAASPDEIGLSHPRHGECEPRAAYLRGFTAERRPGARLEVAAPGLTPVALPLDGAGAFAGAVPLPPSPVGRAPAISLHLSLQRPDGSRATRTVTVGPCLEQPPLAAAPSATPLEDAGAPFGQVVRAGAGATLAFAGATLEIPAGALERDTRITIRPLDRDRVRPLDERMTNVVPGGRAYRLGPHGLRFRRPVKLTLPVEQRQLPRGLRAADVSTLFFDEAAARWTRVPRAPLAGGARAHAAAAFTTHFTDFVNATITIPDHPAAEHLDPTSIKDLKVGDPGAGMTLVPAPQASSTGTASTGLPIELPPGRNGLTPQLGFSYNSEAGNSWLGVGWDLQASTIQVDTRFGVPRYDGGETYLLDGEPLRQLPDQTGPGGGVLFRRRAERLFERIERIGGGVTDFRWEVTDKSGVRRVYGATGQARLASYVAPGPIFRWHLESVSDPLGNRIDYRYDTDAGSNGEPFRQVYLAGVDYTFHPGSPAAYHVDLLRRRNGGDDCVRGDAISDGRSGFQVLTRCLLDRVLVRFGAQVVRQYDLGYRTGNYGKSLLERIDVRGLDGANLHHSHQFEYFGTAEDDQGLDLFAPPVPYATVRLASGVPRTADGHTHARDESDVQNGRVGIGIPQLNFGIGGSRASSNETTDWRLFDWSGDSLTDGLDSARPLNTGTLTGADRLTPAALTGVFLPGTSPTPIGTLSHVNRDFLGGEAGLFGNFQASVNRSLQNRVRETRLLADMNGDGFPDLMGWGLGQGLTGGVGFQVRLGDGRGGFGEPRPWPNHDLNHLGCSGPALFEGVKDAVGNIIRKVLPLTGQVAVQGPVAKATETEGQAMVSLYRNNTLLWSRALLDRDLSSCEPAPGNGCGGGLTVDANAGDRLYFLMTPFQGSTGDVISWDPEVSYRQVGGRTLSAAELDLREPDGGFIYRSSQAADFRLVGRMQEPWVADSPGTVSLDSVIDKQPTSDDVALRIVRRDRNGRQVRVVHQRKLDDRHQGRVKLDVDKVEVNPGDSLHFEVLSDLPIDPARANWKTVIRYERFCRSAARSPSGANTRQNNQGGGDGGGSGMICGPVDCPAPPPPLPGDEIDEQLEDPPPPPACTVARGTRDAFPLPRELAIQQPAVFYPLFRFADGVATQTVVQPATGRVRIEGNVVKRLRTPGRVVVAVQGVNRLYTKRIIDGDDTGSFPVRAEIDRLAAGEQLFFTVYADGDVTGALTWTPTLNGQPAPVTVRQRAPGFTPDPSGVGVLDVMTGGYRGWSFGEWNAYRAFDEAAIGVDPENPDPDFAPLINVPAPLEGAETAEALLELDQPVLFISFPNPVRAVVNGAKALGRGAAQVAGSVGGAVVGGVRAGIKVVKAGVSAGLHILAGFGRLIHDLLFCRHIVGIRVTESSNTGVELGGGPVGVAFSTGTAQTRAELLDMNGDRFPDVVTRGGIRFNTGTGFASSLSGGLPGGEPRLIRQRNLQGSVGFQGGRTLRNKTDGRGQSEGFSGVTVGAGLNYGVSVTDTDLMDINGDGLPDQLENDKEGNFRVRLNFGYRFGEPVVFPGSPWAVGSFSALQDLLNRFGSDLLADAVRMEDTAAARLSGGFGVNADPFFSVNAGLVTSQVRAIVDFLDLNGDNLPDQVMKIPGEPAIRVKLNLGTGFAPEKLIPVAPWNPAQVQIDPPGLAGFGLGTADALAATTVDGFSGGASAAGFGFVGPVPVTASGGLSFERNDNRTNLRFEDIDGDGGLDHVVKVNGNAQVFARLNKGTKANLLRRVKRPLGGSFELDYRREGNRVEPERQPRVDMPRNQWALASLRLHDGQDTLPQTFTFSYGADSGRGSFHDRAERLDYGYSHVRTTRGDGSTLDEIYRNQTLYERGLLAESIERERAGGPVVRRVIHRYESRPVAEGVRFEALVRRETRFAEASTSDPEAAVPTRAERWNYDAAGNVTFQADDGDLAVAGDDLEYHLRYEQPELAAASNIHRATFVEARSPTGQVFRRRTAHYRPDGLPDEVRELLAGGRQPASGEPYTGADATNPRWSFGYDAFGNLERVVDPTGFTTTYAYDPQTFTHRTLTTEASPGFGYTSRLSHDLRFGLPTELVDAAGQIQRTEYDEFGRPRAIWSPNDVNGGVNAPTPSVEYRYAPALFLRTTADGRDLYRPAHALTGTRTWPEIPRPTIPAPGTPSTPPPSWTGWGGCCRPSETWTATPAAAPPPPRAAA